MRCVKEKELILFYYRELDDRRLTLVSEHIKKCLKCLNRYENIESFFTDIESKPGKLSEKELNNILEQVVKKVSQHQGLAAFLGMLGNFFKNLMLGLFKPQVVSILAILILIFVGFNLMNKRQQPLVNTVDREFDIFQIETQISSDNLEGSIFELYEEGSEPII